MNEHLFRYAVPYANIDWSDGAVPFSTEHQDRYYSAENGLEESLYVFLKLNDIASRLQQKKKFVIAELGFGTGLNFLATLQCAKQNARPGSHLTFISFEKQPLTTADLKIAHAPFSTLQYPAEILRSRTEHLHCGINVIPFPEYNVSLLLAIGPVAVYLPEMSFTADAWYLDGFAPARNNSMWSPAILNAVAEHSDPGTTCSTFTAARAVREALTSAGFLVQKVPGWGKKRDSLRADFKPEKTQQPQTHSIPRRAAIIGAGIAGCSVAHALARHGVTATIFETGSTVASGASGNPAGMAKADFSAVPDARAELSIAGFAYLKNICQSMLLPAEFYDFSGIFRSPRYGRLERLLDRLSELSPDPRWLQLISAAAARERTGLKSCEDGLLYPNAGWINPVQLCKQLAGTTEIRYNSPIQAVTTHAAGIQILLENGNKLTDYDAVILANGYEAEKVLGQKIHGMSHNFGQLLSFSEPPWPKPRIPVIGPGYALATGPTLHIGATYEHNDTTETTMSKREELLYAMEHYLNYEGLTQNKEYTVRRSVRCNSADRLPLVGHWVTETAGAEYYSRLNADADVPRREPSAQIFICTAFGSKGIVFAPFCGEIIGALLCNAPVPVTVKNQNTLRADRFLFRLLKKNQLL